MSQLPIRRPLGPDELLLYMHMAKAAGTSFFWSVLGRNYRPRDIAPFEDEQISQIMLRGTNEVLDLQHYRLMRAHCDWTIHKILPKKPVVATMLRHPVQRIISLYDHLRYDHDHYLYELAKESTLEQFFQDRAANYQCWNYYIRQLAGTFYGEGIYLNTSYLQNEQWLDTAMSRLENDVQFFGISERFDDSCDLLTFTFQWQPARRVERLNKRVVGMDRAQIPQSTIDLITEANELDIRFYHWACRLFESRLERMRLCRRLDAKFQVVEGEIARAGQQVEERFSKT